MLNPKGWATPAAKILSRVHLWTSGALSSRKEEATAREGLEMDAGLSVSFPPPRQPEDTKLLLEAPWGSGPASHIENRYQCVLRESIIHHAPDYGSFFFPLQERIWIMSHRMK